MGRIRSGRLNPLPRLVKAIMVTSAILLVAVVESTPAANYTVLSLPSDESSLTLMIHLDDIDSKRQVALFTVFCSANLYPPPSVGIVDIFGVNLDFFYKSQLYSSTQVIVRNQSGLFYQGSKTFEVPLIGPTILYPFDSYSLNFSVWIPLTLVPLRNVRFLRPMPSIWSDALRSAWVFSDNPALDPVLTKEGYIAGGPFVVTFQRAAASIYRVIVPLFSAFFLLGSTVLLDPSDRSRERFTVHLSVFACILSFRVAVAGEMPVPTPTMGELLAYSLVVSCVIMIISTSLYLHFRRSRTLFDFGGALLSLLFTTYLSIIRRGDYGFYSLADLPAVATLVTLGLLFGFLPRVTSILRNLQRKP